MSSHYINEPTPTASATLHTTVGPIHVALFATQAPLTCKNFLQHCKDNYYAGTVFHRIVPGFIVQGGDPTGTGSGGSSIYEDPEFEYDPEARDPNEKVVLTDELHSRLRFNRRGLLGMAKSEDGSYGSQFFITLANAERELNGQCTLFGRVEGDSIFTVLKIADAELVEGSERPVYPVKVKSCEVGELGPLVGKLKDRRVAATAPSQADEKVKPKKKKKKPTAKTGVALLSFEDGEGAGEDEEALLRPAKPKFNPTIVTDVARAEDSHLGAKEPPTTVLPAPRKRPRSPSRERKPKTPDPLTQLPLPDPEEPLRSPALPASPPSPPSPPLPPPRRESVLSRTNAEIESLKASMRRSGITAAGDHSRSQVSALQAMIPENSIRGRKRAPPGTANGAGRGSATNGVTGFTSAENEALRLFNAFKAKLESTQAGDDERNHLDSLARKQPKTPPLKTDNAVAAAKQQQKEVVVVEEEEEEDQLCDLHFIANCQSCKAWAEPHSHGEQAATEAASDEDDGNGGSTSWLTHELRFGKDTLGKDLTWKREHPEEVDSLVVIDPREKERDIVAGRAGAKTTKRWPPSDGFGHSRGGGPQERNREREWKRQTVGDRQWDRDRNGGRR